MVQKVSAFRNVHRHTSRNSPQSTFLEAKMAVVQGAKAPKDNKKKRVSKKNKSSWRKHCDLKDVEAHLEDVRLDERLGGPFSERPDEELFQIDTQPETASRAAKALQSRETKRKALRSKPLKCYQSLKNTSAVRDPISKRNRVKTKEEMHPVATKLKAERLKQGIIGKVEALQIKNRKLAADQKLLKRKTRLDPVTVDLWSEENKRVDNPFGEDGTWFSTTTVVHNLRNTGRRQTTVPKSILSKLSHVSAVEPPHPGTSYNPSYEDHQALLAEAVEAETKILKEAERMKRVTSQMFSRVTGESNAVAWMAEMSEGLPNSTVKAEKESDDEGEYKAVNPPVKNKKKPLKQLRKIKERKVEKTVIKKTKEERKKLSDVVRISVVKKELVKMDDKIDMLRGKREKVKSLKAKDTRQLSSTKFTPAEEDFNMVEDLAGSMRQLKPEGNILLDRYKSLQKRNIVAPTPGKSLPKKGKVKTFERSTHKMGWEPKGF